MHIYTFISHICSWRRLLYFVRRGLYNLGSPGKRPNPWPFLVSGSWKLNYNSSPYFLALLPLERYDPHQLSWEAEGQEISSSVTDSRCWRYVVLTYWRPCNFHPSWSKGDGDFSVLFWYCSETHWKYSWSLTASDILKVHSQHVFPYFNDDLR